jgi:hypothetical protein
MANTAAPIQKGRPALLSKRSPQGMKKRVTFDDKVSVKLIPSWRENDREEEVGLGWWLPNHLLLFKLSALHEINSFLQKNPLADHKTASHLLYNPVGTLFDGFRSRSTGSSYIHRFISDIVDVSYSNTVTAWTTATALSVSPANAWTKTFHTFQKMHSDMSHGLRKMQAGFLVHTNVLFLAPICFRR